jgi:hypothetical protein
VLIRHPARDRRSPRSAWKRFCADQPNELGQADVTHWQLADGTDVEILNIIDDHSRLALPQHGRRHGRVTRQRAAVAGSDEARPARALHPDAVHFAVAASVRHVDTNCDVLLMSGVDWATARRQVRRGVEDVLRAWREGITTPKWADQRYAVPLSSFESASLLSFATRRPAQGALPHRLPSPIADVEELRV